MTSSALGAHCCNPPCCGGTEVAGRRRQVAKATDQKYQEHHENQRSDQAGAGVSTQIHQAGLSPPMGSTGDHVPIDRGWDEWVEHSQRALLRPLVGGGLDRAGHGHIPVGGRVWAWWPQHAGNDVRVHPGPQAGIHRRIGDHRGTRRGPTGAGLGPDGGEDTGGLTGVSMICGLAAIAAHEHPFREIRRPASAPYRTRCADPAIPTRTAWDTRAMAPGLFSVRLSEEVSTALADHRPVVALESTIFSRLGLPSPHNEEALDRCLNAVRSGGAVPAITAVIDGVARVGLGPDEHDRILGADAKTSSRDLGVAVGAAWPVGVTTVAASLRLASLAGITVFATGGIGGVHRGAANSGDVSADLGALATEPVVCVSAGAKAFLDLGGTLERLDTLGVPVLGWQTEAFPAFYSRDSGHRVPHRVDDAGALADIVTATWALGHRGGVLVANPIPADAEIPYEEIRPHIDEALASARVLGVTGPGVTPWVLEAITEATAGRSIPANLALAEHNATLAAELAAELAGAPGAEHG